MDKVAGAVGLQEQSVNRKRECRSSMGSDGIPSVVGCVCGGVGCYMAARLNALHALCAISLSRKW